MVNWHDPSLLLDDYGASRGCLVEILYLLTLPPLVALIKLNHALAGVFMFVCTQTPEGTR